MTGCNDLMLRVCDGFGLGTNSVFGLNALINLILPRGNSFGFICDSSKCISFAPNIDLENKSFTYVSRKKNFFFF